MATLGGWTDQTEQERAAKHLLRRAAGAEHVPAMILLGLHLDDAPAEAEGWLRRAAATGAPDAALALGKVLVFGRSSDGPLVLRPSGPSTREEGLQWLQHAARHGLGLDLLVKAGERPAVVVEVARAHARDAASEPARLALERQLLRWPHLRRARDDDPLRPRPRPWMACATVSGLPVVLPGAPLGPPDLDVGRAHAALVAGDLDEAVRRAEAALDRRAEHGGAAAVLGLVHLLRARAGAAVDGRDVEAARAYLAWAERTAPRDPGLLSNLGVTHALLALRRRPFDMVAAADALERLVLAESLAEGPGGDLGEPPLGARRAAVEALLGPSAPHVSPGRAWRALTHREAFWTRRR